MMQTDSSSRLVAPVSLSTPALEPLAEASIECILSEAGLRPFAAELDALQRRSREPYAPMALANWLEARTPAPGWSQRTILLRSGNSIEAALYLQECTPAGLPSGYFRGCDALGDTLILCDAGREQYLLQRTIDLLLSSHRAFLVLLERPADAPAYTPLHTDWHFTTQPIACRWHHPLGSSFDDTVALFGRRTRRNLRYALRRVQLNDWSFLPALGPVDIAAAIAELATTSTHPFATHQEHTRLHLATTLQDSFAMGLRDADGRWLSCIIGRRTPEAAEVFWQSNARGFDRDSLCTAMRALFMQEEIARGTPAIHYIGGSASLMQHCCPPVAGIRSAIGRPGLRLSLLRAALKTPLASPTNHLYQHL
jgi:hypothetical protein